ncbi:hypothetical protein I4F81_004548 [Pyropia yezoensis]|uniref:Uncharacterized protein n=1 Tax=Pyropia yezoensis TaxID=2788 RepID=A0ACC3BWQ9_PYRYE|nr:hypothetical protein I4F81_004548 [Neopyropia yezoensis]
MFTPGAAVLGGAILGTVVAGHATTHGRVTGVSGALGRALTLTDGAGIRFTAGAVAGGAAAAAAFPGAFASGGVAGALGGPARAAASGLAVGLGAGLGGGCTSGHGVCGLARGSGRSAVATAVFMATAAVVARATGTAAALAAGGGGGGGGAPAVDHRRGLLVLLAAVAVPLVAGVAARGSGGKGSAAAGGGGASSNGDAAGTGGGDGTSSAAVGDCAREADGGWVGRAAQFAYGALFSAGLAVAGMTRAAKVVAFLDWLASAGGRGDPSLPFVFVGALPVAAAAFWRLLSGRRRALWGGGARGHDLPTVSVVDARLLGGAALFGAGWGGAGVCPGPALAMTGAALGGGGWSAGLAAFDAALCAGLWLARRL